MLAQAYKMADIFCNQTISEIRADYPDLKGGDLCPTCSVKIGLHMKDNGGITTVLPAAAASPGCLQYI